MTLVDGAMDLWFYYCSWKLQLLLLILFDEFFMNQLYYVNFKVLRQSLCVWAPFT